MRRIHVVFPILLVLVGAALFFAPALAAWQRIAAFLSAACLATLYAIVRHAPRAFVSSTRFRVTLKQVEFIHFERGKKDRPPASQDVTGRLPRGRLPASG
jgi:hypothetical protein